MTHDDLSALFGLRCDPVATRDGSVAVDIVTPFSFFDGDGLEIFACATNRHVHLFDDGYTIQWLESIGLKVGDDRRRWTQARSAASTYGVTLTDNGSLEVITDPAAAPAAFARLVSAQLAIDTWARQAIGSPPDADRLIDEAALYLRAWRPSANLKADPEPLQGVSGKPHAFHFALNGELVDVIAPHHSTVAAELHKLVDVRSLRSNDGIEIRVIIDDRVHTAAADQEAKILSAVASSWTMSRLIAASGVIAPIQ